MAIVSASNNPAIRARIDAHGSALALFRASERNRMIRDALVSAGQSWMVAFLHLRFSDYVQRAPFGYPRRPVALATEKLRTAPRGPLVALWSNIKQREFRGWDPWSNQRPPRELEQQHLARNRSRFLRQSGLRKGSIDWKELQKDLRSWAKKRTREFAGNLAEDGVMLPLVLTGDLRDKFTKRSHARAVATAKRARLTVTIPRGDRQNHLALRILGMLPHWEFQRIVAWFDRALQQQLSQGIGQRFAANTGRSVGASPARTVSAGTPRRVA